MKLPETLSRSIGLTQAVAVLLASLFISLVLSAVQLSYAFIAQCQATIELSEEVLTLAEGGATTASWTLDERLATEVIQSLIALGDVQAASLFDERGILLAAAAQEGREYGPLTTWFAHTFIRESVRGERRLSVPAAGEIRQVGTLSIVLAPERFAEHFLTFATPVLMAGLLQALAIGLVLLWLSSRLVTSPLQQAARAIAEVDPENPKATVVSIPAAHQDNELGHLLGHMNQLVERLSHVQEQLRTLATHDPLTKLPNRSFVFSRLERALLRARRNQTRVAVLFVDLDGFKSINDSLGHKLGDDLLIETADRLSRLLRSNDAVGRLGGDEFLIVVEDISNTDQAVATVQRIEAHLSKPFSLGTSEVTITASVGVALFPEDGEDANELMQHADMAMYQAKKELGGCFHFFAPEMSERIQARMRLEVALRRAVELDHLTLVYQPKFDARSGRLAGCEALLRWLRDDRLVVAGEFIEVAERTGMIVEIGRQVLERACAQLQDWTRRGWQVSIAVNVSAQQLRDPNFVGHVFDTAERFGVEPGLLELEITETVLIEELHRAYDGLNRLRQAGFAVSIDDFGTGYSSLSYLTHLPANSLKIDQSFVSGPQSSEVVLDMIIAMAQALQLTTVAEGVETEAQRQALVSKGCDVLQGHLLGRAVPAEEFEKAFLSGDV